MGTMDTTRSSLVDSGLVDVTGLDTVDLDELPDTVLTAMLRRVVDEALHPHGEAVAAFTSALAGPAARRPSPTSSSAA